VLVVDEYKQLSAEEVASHDPLVFNELRRERIAL